MANQTRPGTSVHTFRVPDALWAAAAERAQAEGLTMGDVLRRALAHYTGIDETEVNTMRGRRDGRT